MPEELFDKTGEKRTKSPAKPSTEQAVIELVRTTPGGCAPAELQAQLQRAGIPRDDVRNAVSQLWDRGVIQLGVDRKLRPRT